MIKVRKTLQRVWEVVRGVLGDSAYERYTESVRRQGGKPLTARDFYLTQLQEKYSRPSRCC